MATYVIGDIQGCYKALMGLVEAIQFDPKVDELWLAGDLVNRGPDSLAVLRWVREHEDSLSVVLGNHDLYLIACALGAVPRRKKDTVGALLNAPDASELVAWLRKQPLLHRKGRHVMVHAALHPSWTFDEAEREARLLESILQGEKAASFLNESYSFSPKHWPGPDEAKARRLSALAAFTRLRCLDSSGAMTFDYTGELDQCPEGRIPWWRFKHHRPTDTTVIIGHWAALGYRREPGLLATDSGCAWGNALSAVCLSSGALTQVNPEGERIP